MTQRIAMFEDVQQVLDQALQSGGGVYTLPTYGMAVHWRQRAYTFRKAYAKSIGKERSPYDRLTFPRIVDDSPDVVIKVMEQKGIFTPAEGRSPVIPLVRPINPDDEDLVAFAATLGADDGDLL